MKFVRKNFVTHSHSKNIKEFILVKGPIPASYAHILSAKKAISKDINWFIVAISLIHVSIAN